MGVANLIMLFLGGVLIVFGYLRAREPWARYQALREQDANIARYEAWRGGLRDEGTTGASVAMQVLRRQVRDGAIAIGTGIIFVIAGFALP
jgi:hypothetical protein